VKKQTPNPPSDDGPSDVSVLRDHAPALRRVVEARLRFSKEYANTVMGVTDEELKQIIPKDVESTELPGTFYPACPIRIETWSTHTVIGAREYTHPPLFYEDATDSMGIWGHTFTGEGPSKGGWLWISLQHGEIVLSAQYGRFGSRPGGGAEGKYTFLTIPTNESRLEPYKLLQDPNEDPELRAPEFQWLRRYEHDDPRGIGWSLRVIDLVDRATKP
jgi:hypothetical protein